MMPYEFLAKNLQRAAIRQMYLAQGGTRPIVYLDDEHAGATTFFLNDGIPREHLIPVNFSKESAQQITRTTNVACVAQSIDEYVFSLSDVACSVVWLDYMCRTLNDRVVGQCLKLAPYVSITLSTRGRQRSDTMNDVRRVAKKYGTLIETPVFYKGKSDIANMVRFVIGRHNASTREAGNVTSAEMTSKKKVEGRATAVEVQETYHHGDKVYVDWRGETWLTGVVVDARHDRVRITFDCDGRTSWVSIADVRRNTDTPNDRRLDRVIGTTIRMPKALWRDTKCKGYNDVKTSGKAFLFRVSKRYVGKNRFAVSAISKTNNRPMTKLENFTLSYEQIACFS